MPEKAIITPFNNMGEFADPDLERRYRKEEYLQNRRRMIVICSVTAIAYLLAIIVNYYEMGIGQEFTLMCIARVIVFSAGITAAIIFWKSKPGRLLSPVLITYMILIGISESFEATLHYQTETGLFIPMSVVIVLMFYLFVPVRLIIAMIPSLFMSISYLSTVTLTANPESAYITDLFIFFLLSNGYGIYHLISFNSVRRKEFHALIEQRRLNDELQKEIAIREKAEIRLHELATKDELTSVYNRRFFMDMFTKEFNRSQRYSYPLSLLMIDADHFKSINDTYGHNAGDKTLIHLTDLIQRQLRHTDILARFGGEEFSILLPSTNLENAFEAARRICTSISETPFENEGVSIPVTVSIGVVTLCDSSSSQEAMLKTADDALYRAKETGRNQVVSMLDLEHENPPGTDDCHSRENPDQM